MIIIHGYKDIEIQRYNLKYWPIILLYSYIQFVYTFDP